MFCIVENGTITNIIVADEAFAAEIGALPYYDGAVIGESYNPPVPEPEPTTEEILDAMLGVSRYE